MRVDRCPMERVSCCFSLKSADYANNNCHGVVNAKQSGVQA